MNKSRKILGGAAVFLYLFAGSLAFAEIKMITATGEYRMGDNDTRTDAKRLALLDAKRLALEQAGTYLESVTEVKNLKVSHDELRAYTAGIVEVLEQTTTSVMEGQQQVVRVAVTAKIDTIVVARQIDALRKNETVKAELLSAQQEADRLRRERDALQQDLAGAKSKIEVDTLMEKRREALTDADVNALVSQAWVALGLPSGGHGRVKSSAKGRSRARRLITQALALDPLSPEAHLMMGELLFQEKNFDGAIAAFHKVLTLDPDSITISGHAHKQLGMLLLLEKGDADGAIVELNEAIRLAPKYAEAHALLGVALSDKGDLDGATNATRVALQLVQGEHNKAILHSYLGRLLWTKGDLDGAIAAYRSTIRLEPNDANGHDFLAQVLLAKGLKKEAAQEFREFLRLAPDTPTNRKRIEEVRAWLRELE